MVVVRGDDDRLLGERRACLRGESPDHVVSVDVHALEVQLDRQHVGVAALEDVHELRAQLEPGRRLLAGRGRETRPVGPRHGLRGVPRAAQEGEDRAESTAPLVARGLQLVARVAQTAADERHGDLHAGLRQLCALGDQDDPQAAALARRADAEVGAVAQRHRRVQEQLGLGRVALLHERDALQERAVVARGLEAVALELGGEVGRCLLEPRRAEVATRELVAREEVDVRGELDRRDRRVRGSGGVREGEQRGAAEGRESGESRGGGVQHRRSLPRGPGDGLGPRARPVSLVCCRNARGLGARSRGNEGRPGASRRRGVSCFVKRWRSSS